MRRPASKERTSDSVELSDTEALFLGHPTCRNERSTSEDTQNSTEIHLESSQSPAKIWVLEQTQST